MTDHTSTPWRWLAEDCSMANVEGPGGEHVLTSIICDNCVRRASNEGWKFGRCYSPTEENAGFIIRAANAHDVLVAALRQLHDNLAEYQRINNLGGYDNQDMRQAREALEMARKK